MFAHDDFDCFDFGVAGGGEDFGGGGGGGFGPARGFKFLEFAIVFSGNGLPVIRSVLLLIFILALVRDVKTAHRAAVVKPAIWEAGPVEAVADAREVADFHQ